jgi:hypothetical protein
MLTNPESWTPHATYEATKLFVSNLDANQAQRYWHCGAYLSDVSGLLISSSLIKYATILLRIKS